MSTPAKGWQPIAAAKKDGTPYLVGWRDERGDVKVYRASWDERPWVNGWTDDAVDPVTEDPLVYDPTHFLELDELPEFPS